MPLYIIPQRFQHRRGTYLELYARNEVLLPGEECFQTTDEDGNDLNPWLCKVGDGATRWNDLEYQSTGGVSDIAGEINAATGKATPVDADELALVDSAASNVLKKLTWANLKATLKTYFDTLYDPLGSTGVWVTVKKTATTNRASTTTLADDPHLTFSCSAGTTYGIRARLFFEVANGTMDVKIMPNFTGTTNAVINRRQVHVGSSTPVQNITNSLATTTPDASAASLVYVEYDIMLDVNTAGTFAFQWAQNVSNASNLTLHKTSRLEYATF